MRKVLLILMAFSLAGCAHQEAERWRQQAQMEEAAAKAVCDSTEARPELDPLREQVAFDASKATVAQLADSRKPTADQKAVIMQIDEISKPCEDAVSAYFTTYSPVVAPVHAELGQAMKQTWAKLLAGEMTFGQFNSERASMSAAARSKAQSLMSSQAAYQAQMQMQQQQLNLQRAQYINSLQQTITPKRTNCYRYGNNVQCTQY